MNNKKKKTAQKIIDLYTSDTLYWMPMLLVDFGCSSTPEFREHIESYCKEQQEKILNIVKNALSNH